MDKEMNFNIYNYGLPDDHYCADWCVHSHSLRAELDTDLVFSHTHYWVIFLYIGVLGDDRVIITSGGWLVNQPHGAYIYFLFQSTMLGYVYALFKQMMCFSRGIYRIAVNVSTMAVFYFRPWGCRSLSPNFPSIPLQSYQRAAPCYHRSFSAVHRW